jgi:hypothetical protein
MRTNEGTQGQTNEREDKREKNADQRVSARINGQTRERTGKHGKTSERKDKRTNARKNRGQAIQRKNKRTNARTNAKKKRGQRRERKDERARG